MEKILVPFLIITLISINSRAEELILSSGLSNEISIVITPCKNHTDCDGLIDAECINEACECNGTKFCKEKSAGSIVVTKIGQTCKTEADCNIVDGVCKEEVCACKEGRVASSNGKKCLEIVDALGGTCEERIQCKVTHSSCQDKKCVCQQQMHEYDGACYRDVALGERCHLPAECSATVSATCTNETCSCKEGYVQNQATNKCLVLPSKIDGPCSADIQCSTKFGKAYCEEGHCHCEKSYQYKFTKEKCVVDLLLGEACQNHTDCHGPEDGESRSECILGFCKCRSEFHEEHGFCTSGGIHSVYVPSAVLLLVLLFYTCFNSWFIVHVIY